MPRKNKPPVDPKRSPRTDRDGILADILLGLTYREICEKHKVSRGHLYDIRQEHREEIEKAAKEREEHRREAIRQAYEKEQELIVDMLTKTGKMLARTINRLYKEDQKLELKRQITTEGPDGTTTTKEEGPVATVQDVRGLVRDVRAFLLDYQKAGEGK